MQSAYQVFKALQRTNADCAVSGQQVVPLTKDYTEYYRLQLDYIGIIGKLQDEVIALLADSKTYVGLIDVVLAAIRTDYNVYLGNEDELCAFCAHHPEVTVKIGYTD